MSRGQAHTLEGIVAGIVLLASLVFALQATTVTPLSASTSNEYIGTQLRGIADGTLATGAETGSLKDLVLHWDEASGKFVGAGEDGYYVRPSQPPTLNAFIESLQAAYEGQGVAFNIYVQWEDRFDAVERRRLLYQGAPTDNAVSASRVVTIYDGDFLTGTMTRVDSSSTYFAPDRSPDRTANGGPPDTPLFAVVTVEVVVWRL